MKSTILRIVRIRDLTDAYVENVVQKHSWRRYEKAFPALFRHYFRFWAKRSYPDVKVAVKTLRVNAARVRRRLQFITERFTACGLRLDQLDIVLFVDKGCSNGHAFFDSENSIVWLPLETYPNTLLIDVFATHELLHALHYRASPSYYFSSVREQQDLGRLLVSEGIATYLTRAVLDCSPTTALWGGYLPKRRLERWHLACARRLNEMADFAIRHFHSGRHAEFFQALAPADIMRYRGGYFLGDVVIENIVRQNRLSPSALLRLSRSALDELVLQQLKSISEDRE